MGGQASHDGTRPRWCCSRCVVGRRGKGRAVLQVVRSIHGRCRKGSEVLQGGPMLAEAMPRPAEH